MMKHYNITGFDASAGDPVSNATMFLMHLMASAWEDTRSSPYIRQLRHTEWYSWKIWTVRIECLCANRIALLMCDVTRCSSIEDNLNDFSTAVEARSQIIRASPGCCPPCSRVWGQTFCPEKYWWRSPRWPRRKHRLSPVRTNSHLGHEGPWAWGAGGRDQVVVFQHTDLWFMSNILQPAAASIYQ